MHEFVNKKSDNFGLVIKAKKNVKKNRSSSPCVLP